MSELDDDLKKVVSRRMEDIIQEVRATAERKLDNDLARVKETLERTMKSQLLAAATAIVSLAAIVVVIGMYTQTQDVKKAVIDLQNNIISAQTVIRESTNELQRANADLAVADNKLKAAADELASSRSAYDRVLQGARAKP
jgi:hypothetical protein